jgi:hypothetical protein
VERLPIPVKPNTFRSNSPSNEDLESHKDTNKSIDGTDSSDGEYLAIHPFRKQDREKKKQAPVEDKGIAIQNGETIGITNDDGNEVEVIGNGNFFKDDIGHKDVDECSLASMPLDIEVVVSDEE